MRILVLGATGMLGHRVVLRAARDAETFATIRGESLGPALASALGPVRVLGGVAVEHPESMRRALDLARPDAVVDAIGVVKQLEGRVAVADFVRVNALFPHELAALCRERGIRLVHVGTDCVFSGERGGYRESDRADADDVYGRSKRLGEPEGPGVWTIRTSIVGRELAGAKGLVEWLLANRGGRVAGYRRSVFSGVTTVVLADWIVRVLRERPDVEGLWHVGAPPTSKLALLETLARAFGLATTIDAVDEPRLDRSLDGSRFALATGFSAPSWAEMAEALAGDDFPYEEIRGGSDE